MTRVRSPAGRRYAFPCHAADVCPAVRGYLLGASEGYVALWVLRHPFSTVGAIAVEALAQAARHAAFFAPGALGVQEAVVVLLARLFGIDEQAALSLALVRRGRELVSGCAALASWQYAESRRAVRA